MLVESSETCVHVCENIAHSAKQLDCGYGVEAPLTSGSRGGGGGPGPLPPKF